MISTGTFGENNDICFNFKKKNNFKQKIWLVKESIALPNHTSFHTRLHQGTTSQQNCHIPVS